jgi:polyisoprenyl-teichoic acid--peptidoglycan teichoic acid transferase
VMDAELRDALLIAAERGSPRGASAVVEAAAAQADGAPMSDTVMPPRRRLARVALVGAASLVAAVMIAGAGAYVYVREKVDDIETVDVSSDLAGAATSPSEPMTVLVVGSDRRAGVVGSRADTIMVLRIDPIADRAALLSIPRDAWVPIAGASGSRRINTALAGGPGSMIATVQDLLGIPLDHYVEVDFDGFRRIVDAVGGVNVPFPHAARDAGSGLDIADGGCAHLNGESALALVRSRRYEEFIDGRWRADPAGDLGRIARQQAFLAAVLDDVASSTSPLTLNRLLDAAADHVVVDDGLGARDLLGMARRVRSAVVTFLTVPARPVDRGGAVLELDEARLTEVVAELVGGSPSAPPTTSPPARARASEPAPAC